MRFTLDVSLVMWLTAAFLWITALYFLVRMPTVDLSRGDETTTELPSTATLN
jgi:hypothetical protein